MLWRMTKSFRRLAFEKMLRRNFGCLRPIPTAMHATPDGGFFKDGHGRLATGGAFERKNAVAGKGVGQFNTPHEQSDCRILPSLLTNAGTPISRKSLPASGSV